MERFIYKHLVSLNTVIMVSFCFSPKKKIYIQPSQISPPISVQRLETRSLATQVVQQLGMHQLIPGAKLRAADTYRGPVSWELPTKMMGFTREKLQGKKARFNDGRFLLTGVC